MDNQKSKSYISSLLFFILGSCGNNPQKVVDPTNSTLSFTQETNDGNILNAAAKEAKAHNFVEIEFSKSSDVLSKSALMLLEAASRQANQGGQIKQIIVLSWADEEYPSKKRDKLSKEQISLAEKRNLAIGKYFESISSIDVDFYNMAERPNIVSRWFNMTDSKLKNSLIAAGLPSTGEEFKYSNKASRAVILFKVD